MTHYSKEGGSARQPARRTVFDLWQYYRRLGQAQSIPVEDPPPEWRGAPTPVPMVPAGDVIAAVLAQAAAIQALADELRAYRTQDRVRLDQLEAWMDRMIATVPGAADMPVAGARRVPPAPAGSPAPAAPSVARSPRQRA